MPHEGVDRVTPSPIPIEVEPTESRGGASPVSRRKVGSLRSHTVNDNPPSPPGATARQLRKFGSGLLGTAEGGSFALAKKDSTLVKATKVVTASSSLLLTTLAVSRTVAGRMSSTASGLSKLHMATVTPAVKAGLAAAVKPLGFAYGAYATLASLKRFYDIAYDTTVDISKDKSRQEMQALLKDYDPVQGKFVDPISKVAYDDPEKVKRLNELAGEKNTWHGSSQAGSLWRTRGQRALDSLASARDATTTLGFGVSSLLSSAAVAGSAASLAASGMAVATHTVFAATSFAKAGVQTSAIANMEHARRLAKAKVQAYQIAPGNVKVSEMASTNRLLTACANRMIQERVYTARVQYITGISYSFSAVLNGLSYAGIVGGGPLIAGIISTLIYAANSIGSSVFERWHATVMTRRRDAARAEMDKTLANYKAMGHDERIQYLSTIDKQSAVGTLELILLDTLRSGSPTERREAFAFFQACGISDNTIKSFIAEPSMDKAWGLLQTQMYSARTHLIPKNIKYAPEAMGYITGLTYASRVIRGEQDPLLSNSQLGKLLREDPDFMPGVGELAVPGGYKVELPEELPEFNGAFVESFTVRAQADKEETDATFDQARRNLRRYSSSSPAPRGPSPAPSFK